MVVAAKVPAEQLPHELHWSCCERLVRQGGAADGSSLPARRATTLAVNLVSKLTGLSAETSLSARSFTAADHRKQRAYSPRGWCSSSARRILLGRVHRASSTKLNCWRASHVNGVRGSSRPLIAKRVCVVATQPESFSRSLFGNRPKSPPLIPLYESADRRASR